MVEHKSQELTEDEATLYDRQIRLWGLDSQKRLRAAKILVIGMKGLGAEICKNIILAGVKSLLMMDHEDLKEEDLSYQFLAPRDSLGKNIAESSLERARQLNPMVEVSACPDKLDDKSDAFFTGFDVICATQCTLPQIVRLNQICRMNGIKFFAGDIFGFFGYIFADLQIHEFSQEVKLPHKGKASKDTPQPTVTRKDTATFVPFQDLLDIDWTAEEMASTFKKMSNGYFIMRVLQEFRKKEGHNPSNQDTDLDLLKKTRDTVLADLKVDPSRVPDAILQQSFSQVCPSCAIVGGVLSQEVIKAVSQRDRPHNNCFFFDPETCSGKVECLGN